MAAACTSLSAATVPATAACAGAGAPPTLTTKLIADHLLYLTQKAPSKDCPRFRSSGAHCISSLLKDIYERYNMQLDLLGETSGMIPILKKSEEIMGTTAQILYPEILYSAMNEALKLNSSWFEPELSVQVFFASIKTSLKITHFTEILEKEHGKYGIEVQQKVLEKYNELLKKNGLPEEGISKEGLIAHPHLFFLAYGQVLAPLRVSSIRLRDELLACIREGDEVYPISCQAALIHSPTSGKTKIIKMPSTGKPVATEYYFTGLEFGGSQLESTGRLLESSRIAESCLAAAKLGSIRITYPMCFIDDVIHNKTAFLGECPIFFDKCLPRLSIPQAFAKLTLSEMLLQERTILASYSRTGKKDPISGKNTYDLHKTDIYLKHFVQCICLLEKEEIDSLLSSLRTETKCILFAWLGTTNYKILSKDAPHSLPYLVGKLSELPMEESSYKLSFHINLYDFPKGADTFTYITEKLAALSEDAATRDYAHSQTILFAKKLVSLGKKEEFLRLATLFPFLFKQRDFLFTYCLMGDTDTVRLFLESGIAKSAALSEIIDTIMDTSNGLKEEERLTVLSTLLASGCNPNAVVADKRISLPMIERILLSNSDATTDMRVSLARLLLQSGAKPTEKVLQRIRRLPKEYEALLPLLQEKGFLTIEQLRIMTTSSTASCPRDELARQIDSSLYKLHLLAIRYSSNPKDRHFETIEEIKKLKKSAKDYIKAHAEDLAFAELYHNFALAYDAVVSSHMVLSLLRSASRNLRGISAPTKEGYGAPLLKLVSMWTDYSLLSVEELQDTLSKLEKIEKSLLWKQVRTSCLEHIESLDRSEIWRHRSLVCIHGSPLMPGMSKKGALTPAGELTSEKTKGDSESEGIIPPFAGQLSNSIHLHNKHHISCSPIDSFKSLAQFRSPKGGLFGSSSQTLQSYNYARLNKSWGNIEKKFNFETSKKRVAWDNVKSILEGSCKEELSIDDIFIDILRLKAWDPEHCNVYLGPLKSEVERALADTGLDDTKRKQLLRVLEALNATIALRLSEEDKALIEKRMPILFGTTSLPTLPYAAVTGKECYWEEVFIEGKAEFGKDIQVAFVEADDLEFASGHLNPLGVSVFRLQAALALETEAVARGMELPTLALSPAEGAPQPPLHDLIGAFLEREILPAYGRPFPERPSYRAGGSPVEVECPKWGPKDCKGHEKYPLYLSAVQDGAALPRTIHGKMHAVRTSLASQILFEMYKAIQEASCSAGAGSAELPPPLTVDRRLLAMAAAAHDSQRQDEGTDHWDDESGKAFGSWLASKGASKKTVELFTRALAEKDPKDGDYKDLEQRIIHDADCLEIVRVLDDVEQFEEKFLAIPSFNGDQGSSVKAQLPALVAEWFKFVKITESDALKLHLEHASGTNYYKEVMGLLAHLVKNGHFPTIATYLPADMMAEAKPPSAEVLRLIPDEYAGETDASERSVSPSMMPGYRGAGAGAGGT